MIILQAIATNSGIRSRSTTINSIQSLLPLREAISGGSAEIFILTFIFSQILTESATELRVTTGATGEFAERTECRIDSYPRYQ